MPNINPILDFLDFIRFEKSLITSFFGILGYLLFNPTGIGVLFACLSSFCVVSACRAHNSLNDKKEDKINRRRINPLAGNKLGKLIIISLLLSGMTFTIFMPLSSTLFYLIVVLIETAYSGFRLKSYFLAKNIVSGLGLSTVFLMGTGFINAEVILYFFLIFMFIFNGSIISDIMDFRGDKTAGLRTTPVVLGVKGARKLVYMMFLAFVFITFQLELYNLAILSMSSVLAILLMATNREKYVHKLGGLSFILTFLLLL